jgi:plasmid stabilization system protein ParE
VRLKIATAARRDVEQAIAFVAADNRAAAERLAARFDEAVRMLLDFPGLGARKEGRRRRTQVPGTPFRIFYRVEGDTLVILRVWHGARQWPPASS